MAHAEAPEVEIITAATASHVAAAAELFREYAASLGFSLDFQNFDQEVAGLPGQYASPRGRLLLAMRGRLPVGCVALHPLSDEVCEMKRLYVRPAARGLRIGRLLVEHIVAAARTIGYSRIRLDTVRGMMDAAIALYRRMGFRETEAYCFNPSPHTLFLELDLKSRAAGGGQEQ